MFFLHILILYHLLEEVIFTLYYLYTTTTAIEKMENPEERLLLKYRYLKNESWEDISYELNVSYRTVHRIHASALNNFVVPE